MSGGMGQYSTGPMGCDCGQRNKNIEMMTKIEQAKMHLDTAVNELQESADSRYAAKENGPGNTRHDAAANLRFASERIAVICKCLKSALKNEEDA